MRNRSSLGGSWRRSFQSSPLRGGSARSLRNAALAFPAEPTGPAQGALLTWARRAAAHRMRRLGRSARRTAAERTSALQRTPPKQSPRVVGPISASSRFALPTREALKHACKEGRAVTTCGRRSAPPTSRRGRGQASTSVVPHATRRGPPAFPSVFATSIAAPQQAPQLLHGRLPQRGVARAAVSCPAPHLR